MNPRAVVGAYKAAALASRHAPAPLARAVGRAAGSAAYRLGGERRTIAARNLRRVLGATLRGREAKRLGREVFCSYARYYVESFRLPGLDRDEVAAGFTVEGFEHVEAAFDRGVGPILALPHLGGWEWAGFWLTRLRDLEVTVVAEALEPPELFEWFTSLRAALGMHVVPLGPQAGTAVIEALKAKHVLCLLSDRYLSGAGVDVEFFGEVTTLPAGPATLALRTGAALLPAVVYFTRRGVHGRVLPPLATERKGRLRDDVTRVTQELAGKLEELITVAPEQWHLLQPNWPSDFALLGRVDVRPSAPRDV